MSRDALVVGINQYQALPALSASAADAEAVAARLQAQGEFRVQRLPEVIKQKRPVVGQRSGLTTQMLESALIKLFKPKGKSIPATALFYFSGHGLQREAGIQEGYLATSDTNPGQGNFGISLDWLRRLLQNSPVRQIVVILDCCHSGELLTFRDADPGARPGTDRLFMAASREYESAYEALEGQHSVFTKALLSGLNPYEQQGGKISNYSLTEHVSQKLRGELQQPLFESSGSEIVLTRVSGLKAAFSKTPISTLARLKQMSFGFCPYRGLSAFDEAHADYFFGRDALTQALLDKIESGNFCALVGASSSGKTSLLRAGLMHHLRKGDRIPGSDSWTLKLITPTQQPLKALAAAFTSTNVDSIQRAEQMHQAERLLRDQAGEGLGQIIRAALMKPGQTSIPSLSKLWLIIDQFEELFAPEISSEAIVEKQLFIRCLLKALEDPSIPLGVVIGMRADASDALLDYPELKTLVDKNTVLVTSMSYEQTKEVVQKPAEKMGLKIDENLLYTLLLDTSGAPGELALLQQTLLELWRTRNDNFAGSSATGTPTLTMESYMNLGGVKRVMTLRATEVYKGLSEEMQRAARRIFLAVCELGEGRADHRRRAFRTELINEYFPAELIDCTLDKLSAERLIVISQAMLSTSCCAEPGLQIPAAAWQVQQDDTSPLKTWFLNNLSSSSTPLLSSPRTVEIVHDSLVNDWDLLRTWLSESRSVLRQQRRLERSAWEWAARQRPKGAEYLLGGTQLQEAIAFAQLHRSELSDLSQDFIATSRRIQGRLKLRTSMLIPIALLAGIAASIVSRWALPPQPRVPTPVEMQSPTPKVPSPADSLGPWQRKRSPESTQPPSSQTLSPKALTPNVAGPEIAGPEIADSNYVVVSAGRMPSLSNPAEEVEVWYISPSQALDSLSPINFQQMTILDESAPN
ncbi:caspase family protein [cf. Phormidesmis sp. LEGE 11477]|uniref:caspase family protein n=1 Tax=cf. Phormidesmis sp. LEGE 11477 TaxID=1828680 RepID=UPI00188308EC|nr:caspase family protein [cf. Phormidesmis sp. LEGE 11477]MBE9059877.1 caspase family protein [cf. Phormidesmis sp. LEGE 11477]